MNAPSDSPEALKRHFSEIAPLDAAARRAALDALPPQLRARLESILMAHDSAGLFLAEPTRDGSVPPRTPSDEAPGLQVGPFRLSDRLGEGGFAVVWSAHQEWPVRRDVALKILKPGMDSRQVLARFEAERQALAVLNHPSVCRVLDAGVTPAGRPYFAMELVDGLPLTGHCDAQRLTVRERLDLFTAVCDAVQHAHQKGIIHRDLKPSNILVREIDGRPLPVVIDFGIAKALQERLTDDTAITEARQIVGTPQYMSPEQAGLDTDRIDTRTDVYSLGILLHELLAGTSPYDLTKLRSAGFAEVSRIVRESPPSRPSTRFASLGDSRDDIAALRRSDPNQLARDLRGDLDWIVLLATAKEPDERYPTAYALAQDVRRHLADQPVTAGPPSRAYLVSKFVRRHRVAVASGALTAVAMLAALLVSLYGLREATRLRGVAEDALTAETARLRDSYLAQARESVASSQAGRRARALDAIALAARIEPSVELRNVAIAALALDDVERRELPGPSRFCSAWGQTSLTRALVVGLDGEARVVSIPDGDPIALVPAPGDDLEHAAFSPDGSLLALVSRAGGEGLVRVFDSASGAPVCELRGAGSFGRGPAFGVGTQGEPWLAVSGSGATIDVHALPSGRLLLQIPRAGTMVWPRLLERTGDLLVAGPDEGAIEVWDINAGRQVRLLVAPAPVMALGADPSGDTLAVGCSDRSVYLLDAWTGETLRQFVGHQGMPVLVGLADDRSAIVSHGWDNTLRFWAARDGRELVAPIEGLTLGGIGGDFIASAQGAVARWTFTPSPVYDRLELPGPFGVNSECAFTPDGERFLTAGANGVHAWNSTGPRRLAALSADIANSIALDPVSGRVIVAFEGRAESWEVDLAARTPAVLSRATLLESPRNGVWARPLGDGRRAVVVTADGIFIADQETGATLRTTDPYAGLAESPDVSPDGRWLFTGNWRGPSGRLWDLDTGQPELEIPGTHVVGRFSPAGDCLVIGDSRDYLCLETADWSERWRVGRPWTDSLSGVIGFDPTGAFVALGESRHTLQLVDARTGAELAKLAAPDRYELNDATISGDGSTLLCTTVDHVVQRWDLHELARRLGETHQKLDPWGQNR